MKKYLISLLVLLATCFCLSAEATICTTIKLLEHNLKLDVIDPSGYIEKDVEGLTGLFFEDQNDKGHTLSLHYFIDPDFDFTSFAEMYDYTEWLRHYLIGSNSCEQQTFASATDYGTRSFKTKDSNGQEIYCYMYVDRIDGRLVFASIATSYKSADEAKKDSQNYVNNNIFWANY